MLSGPLFILSMWVIYLNKLMVNDEQDPHSPIYAAWAVELRPGVNLSLDTEARKYVQVEA